MLTINNNTYSLKKLSLTDSFVMEKNGEAIWLMPNDCFDDFVEIFAHAAAAAKFLKENPKPSDEDQQKVNILSGTKN